MRNAKVGTRENHCRVTTVSPDLQLRTLFFLRPIARELVDSHRRITTPPEPNARSTPLFVLIRGTSDVAWGVRNDISEEIADELDRLAGVMCAKVRCYPDR